MKTSLLILSLATMPLSADDTKPAAPKATETDAAVKHADAAAAKKLLDEAAAKKDAKVTVLDIRTPDEFKAGHLAGATNIDFLGGKFEEQLAKLDKSKTYVVHCQSGGRSTKSLEKFKKLGFQSIIHLDGGYAGWAKAGLPVEK